MKRFLLGVLLTASLCGCVKAANPSFSSFATNHFITNNFLIRARLNPSQFDTNASAITITITNIAGVPGGGTLWTNDSGVYVPNQTQVGLTATNIIGVEQLQALGALMMPATYTATLAAGLNDVGAINRGAIWVVGFDSDPANSSLRLDTGNGQGQILFIQNSTTNSGFTMRNGESLFNGTPDSYQILNGDWVAANQGDSILLYNNGVSWAEIGRLSGTTNNTGSSLWENVAGVLRPLGHSLGTNQFTIAEATGWTGAGTNAFFDDGTFSGVAVINPTDTYIPYRANAYTFEDSTINTTFAGGVGTNHFNAFSDDYNTTFKGIFKDTAGVDSTTGASLGFNRASSFTSGNASTYDSYWFLYHLEDQIEYPSLHGLHNQTIFTGNSSLFGVNPLSVSGLAGNGEGLWLESQNGGTIGNAQNSPALILAPRIWNAAGGAETIPAFGVWAEAEETGNTGQADLWFSYRADNAAPTNLIGITRSGAIRFGPGTTNVLYREGKALWATNGEPLLGVKYDTTKLGLQIVGGGAPHLYATTDIFVDQRLVTLNIIPLNSSTYSIGADASNAYYKDIWQDGKHYVSGFGYSGNYSRLAISHSGTNGAVVLDSQSAGTAGSPRNYAFQLKATNQFSIGDGWIQLMRGMTKAEKATITPTNGMVVYQTDNTPGFRGYVNGAWVIFSTAADP